MTTFLGQGKPPLWREGGEEEEGRWWGRRWATCWGSKVACCTHLIVRCPSFEAIVQLVQLLVVSSWRGNKRNDLPCLADRLPAKCKHTHTQTHRPRLNFSALCPPGRLIWCSALQTAAASAADNTRHCFVLDTYPLKLTACRRPRTDHGHPESSSPIPKSSSSPSPGDLLLPHRAQPPRGGRKCKQPSSGGECNSRERRSQSTDSN